VEVIAIDPELLGPAPHELVAKIKRRATSPFLLALVTRFSPKQLAQLLEGGVDDFVRPPFSLDELLVRLRRVRGRPQSVAPPPDPGVVGAVGVMSVEWPALSNLPAALAHDFHEFTQIAFEPGHATREPLADGVAASLCLTHPDGITELTVRLEMDHAMGAAVASAVLDLPPDRTVLAELMREMANLAGGAAKRCLLKDGVAFAMGLPLDLDPAAAVVDTNLLFACDLVSASGRVRCLLTRTRVERVHVLVPALREGHVVVREVRGPNGMLLAPAGAALTKGAVAMILKMLPHAAKIEIAKDSTGL
jgi:CheY-like chemotaxis protein